MKSKFTILLFMMLVKTGFSQNDSTNFDFWLGEWDAYWSDSLQGSNSLTKNLNNFVIEENFKFNDGTFVGRSWTVFDSKNKIWQQTWVDNSGAYLLFEGGVEDGKVILNLTNPKTKDGVTTYMRMVFYNIEANQFDWDWQSSKDKTAWKSSWAIHYKRKK